MKPKLNIWWKLAFISAILDVAALPVWVQFERGRCPEFFPIPLCVPLCATLALPVLYLMGFSLWHWHTRYAGRRNLAWLILFVLTAWPLFETLPASVFVSLAYCVVHLLADARGRGAYSSPAAVPAQSPVSTLPKGYRLAKSACFVLGWALVVGGVLVAASTWVADTLIWTNLQDTIPSETGRVLSEHDASVLWFACQIAKTTSLTCFLSALAVALGAVLIQVSQRLCWRLLDDQEKEELKRGIQQAPGMVR